MFKNYLKVGVRNLLKYKTFSFINVFGLAAAMSVCMLIILMLADQKSYDQFHEKKDRIYRVLSKIPRSGSPNASSPYPLASAMKEVFSVVESATHLVPGVGGDLVAGERSAEVAGYFTDAAFFEVFSFDLEVGNRFTALQSPNSIVITSDVAEKLFGANAETTAIGKTLRFHDRGLRIIQLDFGSEMGTSPVDWGNYTVSGVINSDKYKSHLKFDVLVSSATLSALHKDKKVANYTDNWERYSLCYTYALLHPGKTAAELEDALDALSQQKYAEFEELKGVRLLPQKLTEITPGIFVGNPSSLQLPVEAYYFLAFLAGVIMLSACLNYTNLSTARALSRAKEIGVRKVNGAGKTNLIFQFLTESVLTSLLALVMAFVLLLLIKPAFKGLWVNQYLSFDLQGQWAVYLTFLALALIIGIIAGIYPAFHLSGYAPVKSLKPADSLRPGKLGFRKVLTAFQFTLSLFFIVTSLLIAKQFRHFLEFEYGFNSENMVNIPLQGNDYALLKQELSTVPGVSSISACEFVPAVAMTNGIGVRNAGSEGDFVGFEYLRVDTSFISNLELTLVAGSNLTATGQSERFAVVNETAVQSLGYDTPADILGQKLEANGFENNLEVIGVMKDFRFQTPIMEDKIGPLFFINQPSHFSYLNVKIGSDTPLRTIAHLEEKWKTLDPVHPFKYSFFDDQLTRVNQWMEDLVSIIGFIAFLAIIISCLGLLGIATYTTERRTKEIGIRKVLGAGELTIAVLLSKQFIRLLVISILVAAPLSYLVNNLWLQNFPNRVDFGVGIITIGAIGLLLLGLLTIGSQTIRAAKNNPVESLKTE